MLSGRICAGQRNDGSVLNLPQVVGGGVYLLGNANAAAEKLVEMMDAETWLTAEDCITYGLADRLADQDADMKNAAEVLKNANLSAQQRIDVQRSLAAQLRELTKTEEKPKEKAEPEKDQKSNKNKFAFLTRG